MISSHYKALINIDVLNSKVGNDICLYENNASSNMYFIFFNCVSKIFISKYGHYKYKKTPKITTPTISAMMSVRLSIQWNFNTLKMVNTINAIVKIVIHSKAFIRIAFKPFYSYSYNYSWVSPLMYHSLNSLTLETSVYLRPIFYFQNLWRL